MDLQGMKRKQLQALCKKHGLPANLTNAKMVDSLAEFFEGAGVTAEEDSLESLEEDVKEDSKKTGKKVTFFLEGNQVHQFVDLDPEEEEGVLPKQGRGRKKRGLARCVVLPSVKTKRQSMAMEIRSPVLQRKKAAVRTSMQEGSAKCSDDAVVGHVTRSLRGREIITSVEMGKPCGQVGSKKRKSLATKGVEIVGVGTSYARATRSQVQKSETSEEELKINAAMDRVPDQGDVKKRKNRQETVVNANNPAKTRMQVQRAKNESGDEIGTTKVEDLKLDGFRGGRSKSRKKVSGEEACSPGSSTSKGTKGGLQCREILRRSKRNVINAVDSVVNFTNEQDGILEGRRRKKGGNSLEQKPITSEDGTLDNEKEAMHVEDVLEEPQSAHSRRSTRHALTSPTSSHTTERKNQKPITSEDGTLDNEKEAMHVEDVLEEPQSVHSRRSTRHALKSPTSSHTTGRKNSKKARDRATEPFLQTPISFKHNILDDGEIVKMNVEESLVGSKSQHSRRSTRHASNSPTSSRAIGISSTKRTRDRATKTPEQTSIKPNFLDDDEVAMHVKDTLVEPQSQLSTRSKLRALKSPMSNHQIGVSSAKKSQDKTTKPPEQTPNSSKYNILDDGEGVGMLFEQTLVEPHPQHSRRSKRHVLKSPNSSCVSGIRSTKNSQDIAMELPEQTPTSFKVRILDNGEGEKPVEKTLDMPQSQNSRGLKCHVLTSLTPSHTTRTNSTKKTRSNSKYQMIPQNCDADNQNIQEMLSISTPSTLSVTKEDSKVKINNSAGKGFVSKAREVEQEMDAKVHDEFENEVPEKDERASQVGNEIEENVIKTLGAPTIAIDLVPGEDAGDECASALEDTNSLKGDEGKEFEYLTVRKAKEEETNSHEAPFFPPNFDENISLENSTNFEEINDCRHEYFKDMDPCHIQNEHLLLANDVSESPSVVLGEVLSTNLGSEVDLGIQPLRDSDSVIFFPEESEEREMKKVDNYLGKKIADNFEQEYKESLECEAEDHLLVSVLEEAGLNASFETLQEYAKEPEKSAGSLVEFEGTTNVTFIGQAAEEPIGHEVDSDTTVDSNGVKSSRLETLNDENREDNGNYNFLPSMLDCSENSKNENGSAQSFDLSDENNSSDANMKPVNDDLNSTEEVNCEIVGKENIKTCSDELVSEVQVNAHILEVDNAQTLSADFMVFQQEQSSSEFICNQKEPCKEATTPVCENYLLRKEKCETTLSLSECDFKDELNENKVYEHDSHRDIHRFELNEAKRGSHDWNLDFLFNDESAGDGTFDGYYHGPSDGPAASFAPASGSIQKDCTRGAELSISEIVLSQDFFKHAGETSIDRNIFEGQHFGKLKETNAGDLEDECDREDLNESSIRKNVWDMDSPRNKDTSMRKMKKSTEYEVEDLYNDEKFGMLCAIDSFSTKANIRLGSTEVKINERKTLNDAVKSQMTEFCDSDHEISNDENVLAPCAAEYELETIIELEKDDTEEQARKNTESFESMAEILQIGEVLKDSQVTVQEGCFLSNENTQDDKGADSFPGNNEESRAEADFDGAKFLFAEDNEVPQEETTQIKDEQGLNDFILKDKVDTEGTSFSFGSHGEDQKVLSPSLIRENKQGTSCLDGERVENADINTVTFEEKMENEAILHNELDVQNDDLLVDQADELVERKLISPKETAGRQESCIGEQLSNSGFEDISNEPSSGADFKRLMKNTLELSDSNKTLTARNEDTLEKKSQDEWMEAAYGENISSEVNRERTIGNKFVFPDQITHFNSEELSKTENLEANCEGAVDKESSVEEHKTIVTEGDPGLL